VVCIASYESRPVIIYTAARCLYFLLPLSQMLQRNGGFDSRFLAEMRNEVDTFELVEAGDVQCGQDDPGIGGRTMTGIIDYM
jgi:hypothetical protein